MLAKGEGLNGCIEYELLGKSWKVLVRFRLGRIPDHHSCWIAVVLHWDSTTVAVQ